LLSRHGPAAALVVVVTSVEAALVAVTLVELALVEVTSAEWAVLGLGAPDFAQPRRGSGGLILRVEVSADQPVHSNTITEAAARLLFGHTNSANPETNR
jgi:hypothetical protein